MWSEGTPVPYTIPTRSSVHDALVHRFMETAKEKGRKRGKENEDSVAPLGAEGWKEILQLLKEQGEKIEMLGRAFKVIQEGMLKNNPAPVKTSVNTHKCLVESRMEIQKKLDSLPAIKKAIRNQMFFCRKFHTDPYRPIQTRRFAGFNVEFPKSNCKSIQKPDHIL